MKQREAIEATKREHELEFTRLGQGHNVATRAKLREDRAKPPKLPSFVDGKDDLDLTYKDLRDLQLQLNGRRKDANRKLILSFTPSTTNPRIYTMNMRFHTPCNPHISTLHLYSLNTPIEIPPMPRPSTSSTATQTTITDTQDKGTHTVNFTGLSLSFHVSV